MGPMQSIRPTWVEIDHHAIANNVRILLEQSQRPLAAVIKADAYGHGAIEVARTLQRCHARWGSGCIDRLCVVLVEEGIALREAGIDLPIQVLGGAYGEGEALWAFDLIPTVGTLDGLQALHLSLQKSLKKADSKANSAAMRSPDHPVVLEIDTGMGRLGVKDEAEIAAMVEYLRAGDTRLRLESVQTHLACADALGEGEGDILHASGKHPHLQQQVKDFAAKMAQIRALMPGVLIASQIGNSAASLALDQTSHAFVRPGLALYGASPFDDGRFAASLEGGLRPAMRWRTQGIHLKSVQVGETISYGARWTAPRPSKIMVLPVGYADGFRRAFGAQPAKELKAAEADKACDVLIRGYRAPVVGVVCMDLCMIDVTDVPGASLADEVVLLGSCKKEHIDVEELSRRSGILNYEILTGVSQRVPRRHRQWS